MGKSRFTLWQHSYGIYPPFWMRKLSTYFDWAMFNSYVKLPEGRLQLTMLVTADTVDIQLLNPNQIDHG